jgi:glucose-1-phosphate adenylyltransferase
MRKFPHKQQLSLADDVATIILAGGEGTRLFPLTAKRCKPAVSFAGRYRLIDIPISNSLNSGIKQIYVISQFFSSSLNHHIKETFPLDHIQGGSMTFLYPEETSSGLRIYEGTADAIRKNLATFKQCSSEYFLILAGDQLYNMDLFSMIRFAKEKNADLTIAALPVQEKEAKRMGLLKIDSEDNIQDFFEKPTDPDILSSFKLDSKFFAHKKISEKKEDHYLGSMGIYVFKREALFNLLETDPRADFGKFLIPTQIKKGKTAAFYYNGYWEDIGTISSYYEATLALTKNNLGLDLYNEALPIFSNSVHLPCARITNTKIDHAILSQGSMIDAKEISHSLLGLRCIVKQGTVIKNSIMVGNQFYSPPTNWTPQLPSEFSIGENCYIDKAIIDEHVQIGDNVQLINKNNLQTYDGEGIFIRDGIIIVSAGMTLPNGFIL